ncbi:MAG: formylglycine-generating enzyme family protein, partial [Planctomycetota bacterium]
MQSRGAVGYSVVKCVVLFAIIVVGCQPPDVPGKRPELPSKYTETITSGGGEHISFDMALIAGGTFVMGSPQDEHGGKDDERPQHKVRVDDFYLCTTETTLELFMAYYQETVGAKTDYAEADQANADVDAITGPTPVYGDVTLGYGKKHPAMGMTWHNATVFCKWLSRKTGRTYRLPTEAEWEYACRAGTTSAFGCGNDPNALGDFAWYKANADGEIHEVTLKKPNAWGLYDMLGNVREWVSDFYSPQAYSMPSSKSPATGKVHVARGGDYRSSIEDVRCAARAFEEKWWRMADPQIPKSRWWLPQMDF